MEKTNKLTASENKNLLSTTHTHDKIIADKKDFIDKEKNDGDAKETAQKNYDEGLQAQNKFPKSHQTQLVNFWNLGNTSGYSERYTAANSSVKHGEITWADLPPATDIKEINVNTLNPTNIINLAKSKDTGIDGKSSTGSSSVKEGEEKFILGASYSGTQGISIAEVSGVNASIVHGKRVTWTDGDTFLKIDGDDFISDITCVDYSADIKSESIKFKRTAQKWENIMSIKSSHHTATISPVQASNNIGAVQSTTAIGGLQSAISIGAIQNSIAAAGLQYTFKAGGLSYLHTFFITTGTYNFALLDINTTNTARVRRTTDNTETTIQTSKNNFFNIAANTVDTLITASTSVENETKKYELLTSSGKLKADKVLKVIADIGSEISKKRIDLQTADLCRLGAQNYLLESNFNAQNSEFTINEGGSFVSLFSNNIIS